MNQLCTKLFGCELLERKVTFEVTYSLVSQNSKEFPKDLVYEIFHYKRSSKSLRVSEFLRSYLEYYQDLCKELDCLCTRMAEEENQTQNVAEFLEEAKRIQEINQYGIMKGSTLHFTLLEAKVNFKVDFYLLSMIENKTLKSTQGKEGLYQAQESFSLEIEHGLEELVIWAMQSSASGLDDRFIGQVRIPVKCAEDQTPKEFQLYIYDHQKYNQGTLSLSIHWIWNVSKYLEVFYENLKAQREHNQATLKKTHNKVEFLSSFAELIN